MDHPMTPPDNPFLSPACPAPDSPIFASFVLDPSFSAYWAAKERGWRASGVPCERLAFVALFVEQRGKCGICDIPGRAFSKGLVADHSHSDGYLRGLLCSMCNYRLGRCEVEVATGARTKMTRRMAGYLWKAERRRVKGLGLPVLPAQVTITEIPEIPPENMVSPTSR
jgi:hypothetical protein